jgi:hypothetical protein
VESIKTLATKDDIFNLKEDIANFKDDLLYEIRKAKSDIIKWMFIFWLGQMSATLAIVLRLR